MSRGLNLIIFAVYLARSRPLVHSIDFSLLHIDFMLSSNFLLLQKAMPRGFFQASPPPIVASPESQTPRQDSGEETATCLDKYNEFTIHRDEQQFSLQENLNSRAKAERRNEIHPYVQALTLSDGESCIELENAIFPSEERCSREKVSNVCIKML